MPPKVEIRNGEVWVCLGYATGSERFAILREGEYEQMRQAAMANERKRMAYILEHLEEFADWIQWRGNPQTGGSLLDQPPIWQNDPKEPNANAKP